MTKDIKIPEDLNSMIREVGSGKYIDDHNGNVKCIIDSLKDNPKFCLQLAGLSWRKYPEEKPNPQYPYTCFLTVKQKYDRSFCGPEKKGYYFVAPGFFTAYWLDGQFVATGETPAIRDKLTHWAYIPDIKDMK